MSEGPAGTPREALTGLLNAARAGDASAGDRALALTYRELQALARRVRGGAGAGPEPTELLHEAWIRLFGERSDAALANRAHFMNLAARAMRQVLVDLARERAAQKRGGDWLAVTLGTALPAEAGTDLLALDQALQRLERRDPQLARIVEAHFFAGLSFADAGAAVGISERSARRGWALARAFLMTELTPAP